MHEFSLIINFKIMSLTSKTVLKKIIMFFYSFRHNRTKSIFHILVIVIFCSCLDNNKQYNIPKEKKFKYKQGDTVIFVSNYKMFDTFRIDEINKSYTSSDKDDFEIDEIFYNHIGPLYDSSFLKDSQVNLTTAGAGTSWGDFDGGFRDEDTTKLSVTFNNTSFENVYILENDTNSIYTRRNIYKIYLCRNYGVLKYYYLNKTVWEFYKAITH